MKKLNYTIEDNTLTEILGIQNFASKESAVLEIIKNAYDADSSHLKVIFKRKDSKLYVEFIDNGEGITEDTLLNHWMHVGKSARKGMYDFSNGKRVYAGSKGIGRFALARLGGINKLESVSKDGKKLVWESDCETSSYDLLDTDDKTGTKISVHDLRDNWGETQIEKLTEYLSRTYNDSLMKISIIYLGKKYPLKKKFEGLKLGVNYTNEINVRFDSSTAKLHLRVISDEFTNEIIEKLNFKKDTYIEIDLKEELVGLVKMDDSSIKKHLEKLGSFTAKMFFRVSSLTRDDFERFDYKYYRLDDPIEKGIVLYRNAFSITSYEGYKDWLDLGSRARKSPASATHPTSSWRVRYNQIAGFIQLDKDENKVLKEMSNRQGMEEDEYFNMFSLIIHTAFGQFEEYRQEIIRSISRYKKLNDSEEKFSYINKIKADPKSILELTAPELERFAYEFIDYESFTAKTQKYSEEKIEDFKYDLRILNVLATSGLKASSFAHEFRNKRNNLTAYYDNIVSALKKYDLWEMLNSEDKTRYAHENVPELLNQTNESNKKVISFMDVTINNIEKQVFYTKTLNIEDELNDIKCKWESDYGNVTINLLNKGESDDSLAKVKTSKDILNVVFDNLILNSIQQSNNKVITIDYSYLIKDDKVYFYYSDDGPGLPEKYISKPFKILQVHESSREDGHGLGMWIVNNSVTHTNGQITNISSDKGFKINFYIGVKR